MCRSSKPARVQSCLLQMWLREVLVCHMHLLASLDVCQIQSLPMSEAYNVRKELYVLTIQCMSVELQRQKT